MPSEKIDLPPLSLREAIEAALIDTHIEDGTKATWAETVSKLETAMTAYALLAVKQERERLRPKSLEEKMTALTPQPCPHCDGTLRADTNGYNAFLRCDKCDMVPPPM